MSEGTAGLYESEDEKWEDLPPSEQLGLATPSVSDSQRTIPTSTSRRRRKRRKRLPENADGPSAAIPHSTQRGSHIEKPSFPAHEPIIKRNEMEANLIRGLRFTVAYCLDVARRAILLLKYPLTLLLFLWVLILLLARISDLLHSVFSPLCFVPGIHRLPICRPPAAGLGGNGAQKRGAVGANYPRLMEIQTTTFDELLHQGLGSAGLSIEIKKAEMATADLAVIVRASKLRSRDAIAELLADFARDARKTGRGLQRLNSKIGGALDGIMAVNDWALQTIEEAVTKRASWNPVVHLLPWGLSAPDIKEIVVATFTDSMNIQSDSMQRLILEAEVSLNRLNQLEEKLGLLHELLVREDVSLSATKEELLADLWTKLGGNRVTLRGIDYHLDLLKNTGQYRRLALESVVATLQALETMSADMEDLRERVAAPELTSGRIPVEVHMKSIRIGMTRLKEGRLEAKKEEDEGFRRLIVPHPESD